MPPRARKKKAADDDSEPGQRCSWSDSDDATLVATLRKAKDDGLQADSGWKPVAWTRCAEALKDSPGAPKTGEKCQDHWTKTLKKTYKTVAAIRGSSGFGWDDGLKIATVTADVWAAYIQKHPTAARWKTTPFPLYNDIHEIVEGVVATGAGAFHPGTQVSTTPAATQTQTDTTSQSLTTESAPPGDTQPPATPRRSPRRRGRSNMDDVQTLGHDDLVASSPVQPSHGTKRSRSDSSSPAATTGKKRRRNAEAARQMAASLDRVALALNVVGSPEVCEKAVHLMEDDGEFSDNDEVSIMQ